MIDVSADKIFWVKIIFLGKTHFPIVFKEKRRNQ